MIEKIRSLGLRYCVASAINDWTESVPPLHAWWASHIWEPTYLRGDDGRTPSALLITLLSVAGLFKWIYDRTKNRPRRVR